MTNENNRRGLGPLELLILAAASYIVIRKAGPPVVKFLNELDPPRWLPPQQPIGQSPSLGLHSPNPQTQIGSTGDEVEHRLGPGTPNRLESGDITHRHAQAPDSTDLKALAEILNGPPSLVSLPELAPDYDLVRLLRHPCVVVVLGHRGSGKTALICRLQELFRDTAIPYGLGLPATARRLLPDYYGLADDPWTIGPNAAIYIAEAHRIFHARTTQSAQGRAVSDLVNFSRHRRHTLFVDVQNPAHLDRNILSEADIIMVKQPGPLTPGFERPEFRPILDGARVAFASLAPSEAKKAVWVYAPGQGLTGMLMKNQLPTFWSERLSRMFADTGPTIRDTFNLTTPDHGRRGSGPSGFRKGTRPSICERAARARQLYHAGRSYSEIGRSLGVSKSQAFRLVHHSCAKYSA